MPTSNAPKAKTPRPVTTAPETVEDILNDAAFNKVMDEWDATTDPGIQLMMQVAECGFRLFDNVTVDEDDEDTQFKMSRLNRALTVWRDNPEQRTPEAASDIVDAIYRF